MPIGLDPNQTFKIVLETDKDKDPQPCFVYKYLTSRQWRDLAAMEDLVDRAKSAVEIFDKSIEAISTGLVGWENMAGQDAAEIPFDQEKLADLLTLGEVQELFQKVLAQGVGSEDKKKLD